MATQVLYPDVNVNPDLVFEGVSASAIAGPITNATGRAELHDDGVVALGPKCMSFGFPAHTGGGTPSSIKLSFDYYFSKQEASADAVFDIGISTDNGATYPPERNTYIPIEASPTPSGGLPAGINGMIELELVGYTTVPDNIVIAFGWRHAGGIGSNPIINGYVNNCKLTLTVPDPTVGLIRLHKPLYYGDHLIHNVDLDDEFNQITSKLSGGTTTKQVQFTKNDDIEPVLEIVNSGGGAMIEAQQNSVAKLTIVSPPTKSTDSITIDFLEHDYKIPTNILLWFPGKTLLVPGKENLASPIVNSDFILQEVRLMITGRSTVVPPTCENPDFDITFTLAVQKEDEEDITVIQSKTIPVVAFGDMSVPLKFLEGNLYSFKTGDRIIFTYQQTRQPPLAGCNGADQLADIWIKDLSVNLMGHHFYKGETDISEPPTPGP